MISVREVYNFTDIDFKGPERNYSYVLEVSSCRFCRIARHDQQTSPCCVGGPLAGMWTGITDHGPTELRLYGEDEPTQADKLQPFLVQCVRHLRLPKDILRLIQSFLCSLKLDEKELIARHAHLDTVHFEMSQWYSYDRNYGLYGRFYKCNDWGYGTGPVSKTNSWISSLAIEDHPILRVFRRIGHVSVMLPEDYVFNNRLYMQKVLEKESLDRFCMITPMITMHEGFRLLGMLYYNVDRTRLYHTYPGQPGQQ